MLWQKLREMIQLPDHRAWHDVAQTINFLTDLYASGKITEEQLEEELKKIFVEVLDFMHPDYSPEELVHRATAYAQDLIRTIKVMTVSRRVSSRLRR